MEKQTTIFTKEEKIQAMNGLTPTSQKSVRVRNSLNYSHKKSPYKTSLPIMTVPDQAMTIDMLLKRHANGINMNVAKQPIYEDPHLPSIGRSFSQLDTVDLYEYKKTALERIDSVRTKYEQQQRRLQAQKEDRNRAFNQWMAEQMAKKAEKEPPEH